VLSLVKVSLEANLTEEEEPQWRIKGAGLELSTGGGPVTKKHCEKSDENHQLGDLQNNPKIFQTIPIVVLLAFKNLFNPSVFIVFKFSNAAF
jgi:hypothetical protein